MPCTALGLAGDTLVLLVVGRHDVVLGDASWSWADVEAFEDSVVRLELLQLQLDLDKAPNDQEF